MTITCKGKVEFDYDRNRLYTMLKKLKKGKATNWPGPLCDPFVVVITSRRLGGFPDGDSLMHNKISISLPKLPFRCKASHE